MLRVLSVAVVLFVLSSHTHAQRILAVMPVEGDFKVVDGSFRIVELQDVPMRVIGENLTNTSRIALTDSTQSCEERFNAQSLRDVHPSGKSGLISIVLECDVTTDRIYFCLDGVHQGTDPRRAILMKKEDVSLFPLWGTAIIIFLLLCLSGLFSGLNLGLMSLNPQELKVLCDSGDEKQRMFAKGILPLRERGNFLLCTILLGNVLVNNTLTIFLDGIAGGLAAVVSSTLAIVILGEIFPQAVCSRHALAAGYYTAWLMKIFMIITFPAAYPLSLLLDWILGEEMGNVYERKQLLQLVRMQQSFTTLNQPEVGIITGALTYREKSVGDIMTPLENVKMADINSTLDFKTMTEIIEMGHTRIPCYQGTRDNIVGLLVIKDLAFIDPDDRTPLEAVVKHYNRPVEKLPKDTKLDLVLELFKKGAARMVLVMDKVKLSEDGGASQKIIGICTLEDVIEEIIQAEIEQKPEASANQVMNRRFSDLTGAMLERLALAAGPAEGQQPGSSPAASPAGQRSKLTDQMILATFTYLSTSVRGFGSEHLLSQILRRLVSLPECQKEYVLESLKTEEERRIYTRGQKATCFTLVVEGELHVEAGADSLKFEAGNFHVFGLGALEHAEYISEYTVTVVSPRAVLLQITRSLYLEAVAASKWISSHDTKNKPHPSGNIFLEAVPNTDNKSGPNFKQMSTSEINGAAASSSSFPSSARLDFQEEDQSEDIPLLEQIQRKKEKKPHSTAATESTKL